MAPEPSDTPPDAEEAHAQADGDPSASGPSTDDDVATQADAHAEDASASADDVVTQADAPTDDASASADPSTHDGSTEAAPNPELGPSPDADDGEFEPESEHEPTYRQTSRERQEQARALVDLAKRLVKLEPSKLAALGLPGELHEAVLVCRGFTKNARVRQYRRISQLLRTHELTDMATDPNTPKHAQRERTARERVYEQWRERLVTSGDAALAEFIDEHPMADPQRLRQLLRTARRAPGSGKSKKALLEILRAIREACETEVSVGTAG